MKVLAGKSPLIGTPTRSDLKFLPLYSNSKIMKSIAEKKKSQNIAEYLIYMFQMEDLIRSYQGNMDEIRKYVVSHYPVNDAEKDEIMTWFGQLLKKMKAEKIIQIGHLKELQSIIDSLAKIHWQLLKTDSIYYQTYTNAKPHIIQAVTDANGTDLGNEIQICLNGVYGLLLCRLLGKKVSDEQLQAATAFGEVLSLLSLTYQQRQTSLN